MNPGEVFPEWQRLSDALGELAAQCGGRAAHVLDAASDLWCSANAEDRVSGDLAMTEIEVALKRLPTPLTRGGRLDGVGHNARSYFKSFAGIYILLIQFDEPLDRDVVRAAVLSALPRIEALTLLLPPPGGPGSGSAEGLAV